MLLVLTGLRIGELLALRWKSVDLGAQTLRVTATVYEGHFDTPKTKRSARTIRWLASFEAMAFPPYSRLGGRSPARSSTHSSSLSRRDQHQAKAGIP